MDIRYSSVPVALQNSVTSGIQTISQYNQGNTTACTPYTQTYSQYYPYFYYSTYTVDNTEKAIKIVKMLLDAGKLKCDNVDKFLSLVEDIKKTL